MKQRKMCIRDSTNALAVLDEKGLMPNTLVIAGMNMPLAITAVLMKDNFDDAELLSLIHILMTALYMKKRIIAFAPFCRWIP